MGLYENVKHLAEQKGVSVSKLERELGFARSSIAKFNSSSPSIDKVKAIADYLGVKIDDIVNPESDEKDLPALESEKLTPKASDRSPFYLIDGGFAKDVADYISDKTEVIGKAIVKKLFPSSEGNVDSEAFRSEMDVLEHYRSADPGTRASVRKLLDVKDPESASVITMKPNREPAADYLAPVAAHASDGATPEEQMEDVEKLITSEKEK